MIRYHTRCYFNVRHPHIKTPPGSKVCPVKRDNLRPRRENTPPPTVPAAADATAKRKQRSVRSKKLPPRPLRSCGIYATLMLVYVQPSDPESLAGGLDAMISAPWLLPPQTLSLFIHLCYGIPRPTSQRHNLLSLSLS